MSTLRRFLALPSPERSLVTVAGALLVLTRALVHAESVPTIRNVLKRIAAARLVRQPGLSASRIARVVSATRRRMPWTGACLSEALVTEALLVAHAWPAEIFIGIKRQPGGRLEAHAWVKSGGKKVVCGARHRAGYQTLWSSGSKAPVRVSSASTHRRTKEAMA